MRQIRLRADAGFYDDKIVRAIEARHGKFVIVAKLTKPLKALVTGLPHTEVHRSLAIAECQYQPHRWPRSYRFVIVRKTLPEEDSPQTTLFTVGRYTFQDKCTGSHPNIQLENEQPGSWTRFRSTNETESGETCSTTVTGMRWRWSGWSRLWKAWPELLHDAADSG